MAENPLVKVPAALPALAAANQLRRRVEARLRNFDVMRWADVPYGPDPAQRLYFWQLNDLGPRDGWPVVLLVHGGGWVEGTWEAFTSFAPMLAHRGLLAVAMDYRLAPGARWPAQREDMGLALDALLHQQVDAERVALWGHSAGGHMALDAARRWHDKVRCVVALGAPTDLRRLRDEGPDELGQVFDEADLDAASPLRAARGPMPPTLLVHGQRDRVVSVEHARALAAARPDAVTLLEVPDGDHGLHWPPLQALRARWQAVDWMIKELDPAPRGSKWKIRRKKKS